MQSQVCQSVLLCNLCFSLVIESIFSFFTFLIYLSPLIVKTKLQENIFLYRLVEPWRGKNGDIFQLSNEVISPKLAFHFTTKLLWLKQVVFSQISF